MKFEFEKTPEPAKEEQKEEVNLENETVSESDEITSAKDEKMTAEIDNGTAVEKFHPTPENPVARVTIGLWQTLGSYEFPTRVILELKDGRAAQLPWEEAEKFLPESFATVKKIAEEARELEKEANDLENSIRAGTDVMETSGHLKDALLRPIGKERPALKYLNLAADLTRNIDEIAQQSFIFLRKMAEPGGLAQDGLQDEFEKIAKDFEECRKKMDELRPEIFQKLPNVKDKYFNVFKKSRDEYNRANAN